MLQSWLKPTGNASVAELADAPDLGSGSREGMGVRPSPFAPHTRRDLLRLTGGALAGAAFGADSGRKRPNILFVLLDDLGYGQFAPNADMFDLAQLSPIVADRDKKEITPQAALDAVKSASPNLTRLVAEGTRFTDAYVACPLCAPSRSAIMTSRYPHRFGGYNNRD